MVGLKNLMESGCHVWARCSFSKCKKWRIDSQNCFFPDFRQGRVECPLSQCRFDTLLSDESSKLLDSLAEKVLQDEDSKTLLKEFATAAERVAKAKQELESIDNRERDLADIVSKIVNQAVDEETEIASLVAESERVVLAAEEEVKAAELALVTTRAGGSVDNLRKWESYDIDEDLERIESGKAAAVSVLAGTIASIPFYLIGDELRIGSLLSIGGVVVNSARLE